jgi:purine-binding chemotaxis protein CheW
MNLVRFAVADVDCAIALDQVDEVVAMTAVTPLPESADHLLGAIDLHGTAVPVIDLHPLLGREPVAIRPDQHLLLLSVAGGRLAARCDRVEGLVRAEVQPSPGPHPDTGFMRGLAQDVDRLLVVLDAGALVDAHPMPQRATRQLGKNGRGHA